MNVQYTFNSLKCRRKNSLCPEKSEKKWSDPILDGDEQVFDAAGYQHGLQQDALEVVFRALHRIIDIENKI